MFLWQSPRGPFPQSAPHMGDTPLAQGVDGIPGINVVHSPMPPQISHRVQCSKWLLCHSGDFPASLLIQHPTHLGFPSHSPEVTSKTPALSLEGFPSFPSKATSKTFTVLLERFPILCAYMMSKLPAVLLEHSIPNACCATGGSSQPPS
ncbi:hypothetical protein KIL84_006016 [Mauremys mutica]|uniref:Uncharacterized protein n=1 Tax=Mauremys mutica TaxID=74926 RepID=A0A9D3XHS1_9SAUR|nr:hypothetical protein KIL84_006016 [Mauremys mutica]